MCTIFYAYCTKLLPSINIFQRSKSESPDTLVVKYSTIITDWKFGKVEYSTWDAKF